MLTERVHIQEGMYKVLLTIISQLYDEKISNYDCDYWFKLDNMLRFYMSQMKGKDMLSIVYFQGDFMYEANLNK